MSDANSGGMTDSKHLAATYLAQPSDVSRGEHDIACAAEILDSALLNERDLGAVVSSWSMHGTVSLLDHLLATGCITREIYSAVEQRAKLRLERSDATNGNASNMNPGDSVTKDALARIDQSGRVAKLFGISAATSGVAGVEYREHTSRYELIRKLGQGGLGTVWLARDKYLRRHVALKEIRGTQCSSRAALRRFQREAEITGRLEHPGIVPIYQLGEDAATGKSFYTMRFLGKQTMQDAIGEYHERRDDGDDSPMLLRNLLTAYVSVCQAVGHAHSRNVVHRDLKPENIAIDSFGQVIVIDWGLAKVLDDTHVDDSFDGAFDLQEGNSERTVAGQVLGSPLYMAPEQAAGRIDEIDHQTDVYGLGAILFAILTGTAPHEQSRASSGSTTTRELITAIASGPTPDALRNDARINPILAAICYKAMAKKRYNRYASATALAEDVQRWMAGEPVIAYKESAAQRVGRWVQKHRRLSQLCLSAAIIGIVAVATLAISTSQNRRREAFSRFEELKSDGREIELQLAGATEELVKDVRFMSTLPPIQGIISARSGTDVVESEEVWQARLETIYEGLLRANPDYLSVSFVNGQQSKVQEVVRVERHATEQGFIRRVPQSRLAAGESSLLTSSVMQLEPGDVRLDVGNQPGEEQPHWSTHKMSAFVPVYDDDTGENFGLVVIEMNLSKQLLRILNGLEERLGEIYVTDQQGGLWFASRPGFGVEEVKDARNIVDFVPEAVACFGDKKAASFVNDSTKTSARRLQLDPTDPATSIALVLKLDTQD